MSALSDALNEANVNGWSAAEIARRSGDVVHRATVANVMRGKHAKAPSDEVLSAFVEVFPRFTLPQLRALAGLPAGEVEPYEPPEEAHRLDARQRRAVDELIRLLADKAGGEHGGHTTPMTVHDRIEPKVADVLAAQRRANEKLFGEEPTTRAARTGPSRGKQARKALEGVGEESQDPGDMDPA